MPVEYETLLDLARQRLNTIAASPNFTRAARHAALEMGLTVTAELTDLNEGRPRRALVPVNDNRPLGRAKEVEPTDTNCA